MKQTEPLAESDTQDAPVYMPLCSPPRRKPRASRWTVRPITCLEMWAYSIAACLFLALAYNEHDRNRPEPHPVSQVNIECTMNEREQADMLRQLRGDR
jgi:hypothetical protein